ncbi:hypothetical protein LOD99_3159 [Oopsacas minuta]|uniref:Uncharacterized protein n=1 Tax=Oopsacas minuta TaxID=111878 RepID=A0AAV7JYF6_9METZ|nr:hypothetical protein LOD99_3159 [Oopsacas minuta]
MPFAIPMVWGEQKNHLDDCYFCLIDITGFSAKNKHALVYPDLDSARRPIPHDISLPIPIPKPQQIKIVSDMVEDVYADSTDANYVPEDELLEP